MCAVLLLLKTFRVCGGVLMLILPIDHTRPQGHSSTPLRYSRRVGAKERIVICLDMDHARTVHGSGLCHISRAGSGLPPLDMGSQGMGMGVTKLSMAYDEEGEREVARSLTAS